MAPLFVLLAVVLGNLEVAYWIFGTFRHGQLKALAGAVAGSLMAGDLGRARAAYRALARKLGGDYRAANAWLRDYYGMVDYTRLGLPGGRPPEDVAACALAALVRGLPITPKWLLIGLGLAETSTSRDSRAWGWFHRMFKRGRWLLARARPGLQSEVALIAFLARLHATDPSALLEALAPYLSEHLQGVRLDAQRLSVILELSRSTATRR